MSAVLEPIVPSESETRAAQEGTSTLARLLKQRGAVRLRSGEADEVSLPLPAVRLLQEGLEMLGRGQAVVVLPLETELTTTQAAQIVGVSRPFLVHLLESRTIPFRYAGTHRRIRLQDVLTYKQEKERQRLVLKKLSDEAQELNTSAL